MGLTLPGGEAPKTEEKKVNKKKAAAPAATMEVAPATAQAQAEAPVETADNATIYGVDSKKLIFIAPLGDPSKQDKTVVEGKNGAEGKTYITSTIVGYRFKAEIDLDVPDVELGDDARDNSMSFTGDVTRTRHIPKGTEFDLTRFETGVMLSHERFNAKCLGGDKPMMCTYTKTNKKDSKGAVASVTSATQVPVISLKALTPGASIKDYPMIDVLSFRDVTVNDQKRKERTINPGFEKFAKLCVSRARSTGRASTGGAATPQNLRNQNAATFLNIINAKKAKAQ